MPSHMDMTYGFAASGLDVLEGLASSAPGASMHAVTALASALFPVALCKAYTNKRYELAEVGISRVFTTTNMTIVCCKNVGMSMAPLMTEYFNEMERIDNEWDGHGEVPGLPDFPSVRPALWRATYAIFRDFCVQVTREVIKTKITLYLSERYAWKILKSYQVSAKSKASKGLAGFVMVSKMARTAAMAWIPFGSSELVVSQCELVHSVCLETRRERDPKSLEAQEGDGAVAAWARSQNPGFQVTLTRRQLKRLLKGSLANIVRVSMSCAGAAAGAAVGAAVTPDKYITWGALGGYTLGEVAAGQINVMVFGLDAWARRLD